MGAAPRIAIINATPAHLHAAEMAICALGIRVDLIDPSPTIPGLTSGPTAPKGIVDRLEHMAEPHLRFIGNVELGPDVSLAELESYYDLVVRHPQDLRGVPAPDSPHPDLVTALRAQGVPLTTWHGWHRLDESVQRGQRGWERTVTAAHGIPVMP